MDEILTNEEIEARYKDEWILVEDPETNEALEVLRGKVHYHSKDRDEVYQAAVELRAKSSAILCTVKLPKDEAFNLTPFWMFNPDGSSPR